MSAPATAGVSPARAAWRRLKRNRLALGGLIWVALVTLACFAAPLFSRHDPVLELPWLGALGPGASHPDVLMANRFTVGAAPETSATAITAVGDSGSLHYTIDTTPWEEYQVRQYSDGRIRSIRQTRGARSFDELILDDVRAFVVTPDGQRGKRILGTLRVREPAPAGFSAAGEAVILQLAASEPSTAMIEVTIADGLVASITEAGAAQQQLTLSGDQVLAVEHAGSVLERGHLLGTDAKGRDLWARILYGGRISLTVGLVATIVSLVIGVLYGALSGYLGGRWDRTMMSGVDILYGLPFMFLVILLLVTFGRNIIVLFIALGAVQWLTMARIVRGQVLSLRHREFIEAAILCGCSPWQLITRHLIPNTLGPVIVYTTMTVPVVILEESFLAFLGLTVEWGGESLDSWGALVWQGKEALGDGGQRSWLLLWPSIAMATTLLALNALGDGLRDALDPQLAGDGK